MPHRKIPIISCSLPENCTTDAYFKLEHNGELPAIAILDSFKLATFLLHDSSPKFQPKEVRLQPAELIPHGTTPWLVLPEILFPSPEGNIVYRDGRHRTLGFFKNNVSHFPAVTAYSHVDRLLQKYGLDVAGAHEIYDFKKCRDIVVYGL
jgi:hypothetical protein